MVERYVKDGKVAVIRSVSFSIGWNSCGANPEALMYDRQLAEIIERLDLAASAMAVKKLERDLEERVAELMGLERDDEFPYRPRLGIRWVPLGERFQIRSYDGLESVVLESEIKWITA